MNKPKFEEVVRKMFPRDAETIILVTYRNLLGDGEGFEGEEGTSPHDSLPSREEMKRRRDG